MQENTVSLIHYNQIKALSGLDHSKEMLMTLYAIKCSQKFSGKE